MEEAGQPMDCEESENNPCRASTSTLPYRGLAIIAIFKKFDPQQRVPDIVYADVDRELLVDAFRKLNYGVVVWDDIMTRTTFFYRLKQVSSDPIHNDCETFALIIISHGDKNGKLYSYNTTFNREDVYNYFTISNCPALKDKPKLFIIQACRGQLLGKGIQASGKMSTKDDVPTPKLGEGIEKDNLILYSTFEGNVAFAPQEKGSYFINALSLVIQMEARKNENNRKHIIALLRAVIKETASKNFGDQKLIWKQQPVLVMRLHRLYSFKNKIPIPDEKFEKLFAVNLLDAAKIKASA